MHETLNFYSELLQRLDQRLSLVADREFYQRDPHAHLAALQQADEELRKSIARLPGNADPMLRHFLERQSYIKARDWLHETLSVAGAEHK